MFQRKYKQFENDVTLIRIFVMVLFVINCLLHLKQAHSYQVPCLFMASLSSGRSSKTKMINNERISVLLLCPKSETMSTEL